MDGGSTDRSCALAEGLGRVVCSLRGRGQQKNEGARAAKGDILLFLHVDTRVAPETLKIISTVFTGQIVAGCFRLHVDSPRWTFRLFEAAVNLRAKHAQIIDGDLGFFIKREAFLQAGMFPRLPYMEDIVFSRRIKKLGKIKAVNEEITVSSRKWDQQGFLRTLGSYTWAYLQLWTGRLIET